MKVASGKGPEGQPMQKLLTLGQVAKRFGVADWMLRETIKRGYLPEPPRLGAFRVFAEGDLAKVEAALRSAGYLKDMQAPNGAA